MMSFTNMCEREKDRECVCVYTRFFFFKAMLSQIWFQYHFHSSLVNTYNFQLLRSTRGLAVMSGRSCLGFFRFFREDEQRISE